VNRMHHGRQLLAKLGERIRPTQSELAMAVEEGDPVPHSAPPAIPELRLPPLALITFAWQALIGGLLLALLHFPSFSISAAWIGLAITGFAPLLISIAGGVRHLCPDSIRQVLWFQLTTSLILGAIAFVYFVDQAINDPLVTIGMTGPIEAFSDIGASSAFAYYLAFLSAAILNLAAAITGLVLHVRWKGHLSASPSGVSIQEGSVSDDTLS
ncbi:MAG: hypothetical protein KDM64_02470, partial [Verrucomicrobiae bacterium]|nr:hypothetical protein [Verrucomicrobiae bacterium]